MNKGIKIVVWNANGLALRSLELKTFILNNNIDIILISETHYTQKNFLKIPQYSIYNTNHPDGKAHGGTAIIIKNNIKHYVNEPYNYDYIQATNVTVEDKNGPIVFSAIYCPPKFSINKEKYIKFFDSLGHRFFAGGDYNAKHPWWGSRSITPNPKGANLYLVMQIKDLIPISTGEPTYWPSDKKKIPDLIDFAVVKGLRPERFMAKSCFDLSSDHSPIIINFDSNLSNIVKDKPLYNKKTNWNTYREILENEISCNISLKTPQDIDIAVVDLNKKIESAAVRSTPQNISIENTKKTFVSEKVQQKLEEKRKLRKIWQRTRDKTDKNKYNRSIKELKKCLLEERNFGIQTYLENLTPTETSDYALWKATKKINRPKHFCPPILKSDGSWARTDTEKAETFAEHLEEVFTPHVRTVTEEEESVILNHISSTTEEHAFNNIKVKHINHLINNLKNKKSPGHDKINGKLLKELPAKAVRYITIIINAIIRISYFPSQWKTAEIILIPKPGKAPENVTSYRPLPYCLFYQKSVKK